MLRKNKVSLLRTESENSVFPQAMKNGVIIFKTCLFSKECAFYEMDIFCSVILSWPALTLWDKPLPNLTQNNVYVLTMNYPPSLSWIYILHTSYWPDWSHCLTRWFLSQLKEADLSSSKSACRKCGHLTQASSIRATQSSYSHRHIFKIPSHYVGDRLYPR